MKTFLWGALAVWNTIFCAYDLTVSWIAFENHENSAGALFLMAGLMCGYLGLVTATKAKELSDAKSS